MRVALASAEVGDDHLDGDPTTRQLERRIAALLGKEAALFFPTGTMANLAAIMVHARPGSEMLVDADSHVVNLTAAGASAVAGVQPRVVTVTSRVLDARDLARAARPASRYTPPLALVCVENTHNGAGGVVTPLAALRDIAGVVASLGVPLHLDGARLWNVEAATGVAVAEYAGCADTVMVSFSKGLGAPAGAALAGTQNFVDAAWLTRKRLGGAMRQSGVLAAAALYGLDHHRDRLADDHANARRFAELVGDAGGATLVWPDTNIVMIDVPAGTTAEAVAREAAEQGVLVSVWSARRVRVVTHLDVATVDVEAAAEVVRSVLERGPAPRSPSAVESPRATG
jgi:threonine aldolase